MPVVVAPLAAPPPVALAGPCTPTCSSIAAVAKDDDVSCDMIGADVGLFLKGPELKKAPSRMMVTLGLVDGKTAIQEDLGSDKC